MKKWGELVIITWGKKCMKYYVGESERKIRRRRFRHRWENIIRMDLKNVEWTDIN